MAEARIQTDVIFDIVSRDSLYERPIPERHRIVFYLGHLEAFDWNLLHDRIPGAKPFHAEFDRLFAFGIDPVGGGLPDDEPRDWPGLAEIEAYRRSVRTLLDAAVRSGSLREEEDDEFSAATLLNVAIEHRLMHAETLAYLLHQLPAEKKIAPLRAPAPVSSTPRPRMIEIPTGVATLGLAHNSIFGWDNEYDLNRRETPAFAIDQYKVTNGQYLEFMQAGGYDDRTLWHGADWEWKNPAGITHPVFWKKVNGSWQYRRMFDEVPLPLDWPVYVSQAEASAYSRWAGKELPSESQWHRAAYATPTGTERPFPWGTEPPELEHGYFDFQQWDPGPVNAFPAGQSAFGVVGLLGQGWEWTSSLFEPFEGFRPFSFYPGYSANFFDGKHFVMKGGSPRTAAVMLRRSFRNWFQPNYQYVYAGFRCVENRH